MNLPCGKSVECQLSDIPDSANRTGILSPRHPHLRVHTATSDRLRAFLDRDCTWNSENPQQSKRQFLSERRPLWVGIAGGESLVLTLSKSILLATAQVDGIKYKITAVPDPDEDQYIGWITCCGNRCTGHR